MKSKKKDNVCACWILKETLEYIFASAPSLLVFVNLKCLFQVFLVAQMKTLTNKPISNYLHCFDVYNYYFETWRFLVVNITRSSRLETEGYEWVTYNKC